MWRTRDGSWYIISECCEPAAGILHRLEPDQVLNPETHDDIPFQHGWYVTPLAGSDVVITGDVAITIGPVGGEPWFTAETEPFYAHGSAVWDPYAEVVRYIGSSWDGETAQVVLVEDDGAGGRSSVPLEWATGESYISGLARHYSGQLLAVEYGDGVGSGATQLIVLEPDGSLVARYGFGTGELGGYDEAARYLIYVDGDGVVRWRGEGRTGVLAEGFISASW